MIDKLTRANIATLRNAAAIGIPYVSVHLAAELSDVISLIVDTNDNRVVNIFTKKPYNKLNG